MRKTIINYNFSWAGFAFVVLLVLKLAHVVDISWWWITLPLWFAPAMIVATLVFCLVILVVIIGICLVAAVCMALLALFLR
jgi:hypothetical protein